MLWAFKKFSKKLRGLKHEMSQAAYLIVGDASMHICKNHRSLIGFWVNLECVSH